MALPAISAQFNQDFWKRVKIVLWLDQKVIVFANYRLDQTTPVVFQNAPPTNRASMLHMMNHERTEQLWPSLLLSQCAVMAGIRKGIRPENNFASAIAETETEIEKQRDRRTDRQRETERDKIQELGRLVEYTRDVFSAYPLSALITDCSLAWHVSFEFKRLHATLRTTAKTCMYNMISEH